VIFAWLAQMLWQNFQSKVPHNTSKCTVVSLKSVTADFRERIRACIPHIANLIKDDNVGVREAGGSALVKLSEQGTISVQCAVQSLNIVAAELRASIKAFIPQIIDLLNDNDAEIRGVGANTLAQLSGQGDIFVYPTVALLRALQRSFGNQSGPPSL
jgi:HEAT repeat protein